MPVNIKGKEYVTVAERMEQLRQSGKRYEMVESKAIVALDRVIWQVSMMIDDRLFIGSAEAHLNARPGSADATDPFACAETSAIGRLLGLAGFGSLDSIASADEIVRVDPQNGHQTVQAGLDAAAPSPAQIETIKELALHTGAKIRKPATFAEAQKAIEDLQAQWDALQAQRKGGATGGK